MSRQVVAAVVVLAASHNAIAKMLGLTDNKIVDRTCAEVAKSDIRAQNGEVRHCLTSPICAYSHGMSGSGARKGPGGDLRPPTAAEQGTLGQTTDQPAVSTASED